MSTLPSISNLYGLLLEQDLKACRGEVVAGVVIAVILVFLALVPALAVAAVLDKVVHAQAYATLVAVLVLLFIFHAAETALDYLLDHLVDSAAQSCSQQAQARLLSRIQLAEFDSLERSTASHLHSRYASISGIVRTMVEWRMQAPVAPIAFITIFGCLAIFSLPLSIAILLLTLGYAAVNARLNVALRVAGRRAHRERDSHSKRAFELFSALDIARSTGTFSFFSARLGAQQALTSAAAERVVALSAKQAALGTSYQRLVLAVILGIGAYQTIDGTLSVGQLVMANMLSRQLATTVRRFSLLWQKRAAAIVEIEALGATISSLRKNSAIDHAKNAFGSIELRNVSYRYAEHDRNIFQSVNLKIPNGCIVAVVGPSGSGKSTLLKLLARLYEPSSGHVNFVPANINGAADRLGVSYVGQGERLFAGSLKENILLGREGLSQQDLDWAASQAGLEEFVATSTAGFDHDVGDFGNRLSGGQKQRVAIARALASRPAFLIMDEPTSALDDANKWSVMEALSRLRTTCTIVVATHDTDVMACADLIVDMTGHPIEARVNAKPRPFR